jgi:hypothetical protein
MALTLNVVDHYGSTKTAVKARDMEELLKLLSDWIPPEDTSRMVVSEDGNTLLTVKPDSGLAPPPCNPLVAAVMARLTVHSLLRRALGESAPVMWDKLLPGDPLITLAAETLGGDLLRVLRKCVPGSKALPGDWAPATLLWAVIGQLTLERFAALVAEDHDLSAVEAVTGLLERLPTVESGMRELDAIAWGLGERARLLLVARGWLPALDAG